MPVSQHAERLRRAALHAYDVLDSEPLPELGDIVELAALLTACPVAAVNLLDDTSQRQPAVFGTQPCTVPIADSLCRIAVREERLVAVSDASAVPEFATSPFVDGRSGAVRTYAAVPLVVADGTVLGTLCVVDDQVRTLTPAQLRGLELLAAQVVAALESRRQRRRLTSAIDELDRLAHVDGLTGLVNRSAVTRLLDRACRVGGWGLLFLDVDDFKRVNDVHGHATGDLALREVAARVRSALRPEDLPGRWAGDELVVLLPGCATSDAVAEVGRRVQAAVAAPFRVDGLPVRLSVSVGATLVQAGSDPVQVLRAADCAMYADKRLARTRCLPAPAAPLGFRQRDELTLETQRLGAIDRLHALQRTTAAAQQSATRSRTQREATARRQGVLLSQNAALQAHAAEHLVLTAQLLVAHKPRVVLAHADAGFRGLLAEALHERGLQVVSCTSDGAQTVGVCLAEQPDLLVLQDGLPDGTGVVEEVLAGCPATLVVAQAERGARELLLRDAGATYVFPEGTAPSSVSEDLRRLVGVG
ncbi:MAG: hypothetical protein JWM64_2127 [Frankiales bacterium]|nr:hypothetical protein [Frankiales bacterium]